MDPDAPPLSSVASFLQHATTAPIETSVLAAGLAVLLLLLLASAVFSGSEVALFSLSGPVKEHMALQGDRASLRVLSLLEHPRQLLITILILNTLVNVAAAIIAAVLTANVAVGLAMSPTLVVLAEVLVLTFLLLVISEITPKLIATRHARVFSRMVSIPLWGLHRVLFPVSNALARTMQAVHGRIKAPRRNFSNEDLKAMAEIGEAHGSLHEDERELIHSIVEFGETTVREIMVSRLDVYALPVTATLHEALEQIRTSGHSRMPLYVEHLDNIIGIVHAKDLLRYLTPTSSSTNRIDWTRIARKPMFVPQGKKLDALLKDFQAKKTHIAIVVDEYGGTAGLVTLENVLEEIVGDIRDEHDETEEALYTQLDATTYRCDARLNLDDLGELLDYEIDEEDFDFETLGGLIFHLTGAIPTVGETMEHRRLRMTVETVENHRIGLVHVDLLPDGATPSPETTDVDRENL